MTEMNFKKWLLHEGVISVKEIPNNILQSMKYLVGGQWKYIEKPRLGVPALKYQWRIIVKMTGNNVKTENDKYYLKIFVECFKPEWMDQHPIDGNAISEIDPTKSHPLIHFSGFLEGWRPGMMPGREIDYKTSAAIKGYPIPVGNPGDSRYDMIRIDSFEKSNNTPFGIAKTVKEAIDKFNRPGEDYDDEPEISPQPSSSGVKV